MKITRRTFEAKKYPNGSEDRKRLNLDWETSEYLPSYKYGLHGGYSLFKTKREAEQFIKEA